MCVPHVGASGMSCLGSAALLEVLWWLPPLGLCSFRCLWEVQEAQQPRGAPASWAWIVSKGERTRSLCRDDADGQIGILERHYCVFGQDSEGMTHVRLI